MRFPHLYIPTEMDYNEDYLNIGTWELEYIFFLLNSIRAIKVLCWPNMNVPWQHVFLVLGNHLYITSAKDWLGGWVGLENGQFR